MKVRDIFLFVAILVSCSSFFMTTVGYAKEVRGVSKDTINYGIICDLSGPAARPSTDHMWGFKNYLLYMNEQGGVHGRKFNVIVEDDHYSVPSSIAAFKKLVFRDGVLGIWASVATASANSLFRQIEKEKVVYTPGSLSDIITEPYKRYVFGSAASYEDNVKLIYDYIMKDLKAKDPKIVYVGPDSEMGHVGLKAARESAKFHGIKPPSVEICALTVLDTTPQVLNLRRIAPDFIIIHGIADNAAALLRDARKFNFKTNFFGTRFTCSKDLIEIAKKASENFISIDCFSSWDDKSPGMAKLREVTLRYQPEKKGRSAEYVHGWVSAITHVEAMKRAGNDLNVESFVNALETIKNFDTNGLTGFITYTSKSHKPMELCKLFKVDLKNVQFVPITDWRKPSF